MKRFLVDVVKVFLLLVLTGALLYWVDPANVVVLQAMGIGVFLVGGTHLTRRILFHRMDLQSIALKAVADNNVPAAIVFAAVLGFLVSVMFLSMGVLK